MTDRPTRGPVVIDTDVYSARLTPGSPLAQRYETLLVGRSAFLSFQTVAELRYGALLRGWGRHRLNRLDAEIARSEIVHTGLETLPHRRQRAAEPVDPHPLRHRRPS